jgi:hypothetical protein
MPGTAVGLFLIDFIIRPFAKIFEKMPFIMLGMLLIFYGAIAYMVLRSVRASENGHQSM